MGACRGAVLGSLCVAAAGMLTGCGGEERKVLLTGEFQLGDHLELHAKEADWNAFKTKIADGDQLKPWGVFLDGHFVGPPTVVVPPPPEPAPAAEPEPGKKPKAVAPSPVVLRLRLRPSNAEDSAEAWRRVLEGKYPVEKRLALSVGGRAAGDARLRLQGGDPTDGDYLLWTPWRSPRSLIAIGVAILVVLLSGWLMRRFFLLRDQPAKNQPPEKALFSLSKSQMLLWVVTVPVAVLLVWAITGSAPAISASVIALLGLGVATRLVSNVVDATGDQGLATLQGQQTALSGQLAQVNTQLQAADLAPAQVITLQQQATGLQVQIAATAQRIQQVQAPATAVAAPPASEGWWADVLSDGEGGVGLHRLQLLLWTGVIWVLFWADVLRNLVIPELDATLVTLSGLSSASFVVLKAREPN